VISVYEMLGKVEIHLLLPLWTKCYHVYMYFSFCSTTDVKSNWVHNLNNYTAQLSMIKQDQYW